MKEIILNKADKMVNKLIEIINREIDLFESFLKLLEKRQNSIITESAYSLDEINIMLKEKINESKQLMLNRKKIVKKLKDVNHLDHNPVVTELIKLVESDETDRLLTMQDIFISMNDTIDETRAKNNELISRSREYITRTLKMLDRIKSPADFDSDNGINDNADEMTKEGSCSY